MGVCNLDYRLGGTLGDDALMTERLYLDDHLTEDLADSDLRPVSGLLVACIEPDNRPKRWSRPVLSMIAGLALAFTVSLAVRSRSARRHDTPRAVTRKTISTAKLHQQKKNVGHYRVARRKAHRSTHPHSRRRRGASREPGHSQSQYTARSTAPVVPTYGAVHVPARSRMPVRARRGAEFGFER
jgi:hypothetical protein